MARGLRMFFFGLLAILCASCGGGSSAVDTVTLTISPLNATVGLGGTQQFTVTASGAANTAVTYYVNGVKGGNSTYGTITQAGLYTAPNTFPSPSTITVTVISQEDTASIINASVTLQSGVVVSVSPLTSNLQLGQTQQFSATVTGSSNTAVTWQAGGLTGGNSSVGTINSSGLYTAPATANTPLSVSVTAVSQVDATQSANASVTIHGSVSLALSPTSVSVQTFATQLFSATVSGNGNTAVTWEVDGIIGGASATGTISSTTAGCAASSVCAVFTAPNSVPTAGGKAVAVTVTAVSRADASAVANSEVTISSPNQDQQASPTPLGVSGGNANDASGSACCGGTLGALVSRGGNQYILSAGHVLARSDLGTLGDSIIQPGLLDSSCSSTNTTAVATLSQFINLETSTVTPLVDAALAQILSGKVDTAGNILQLGATTDNGQPTEGPPLAGSGVAPSLSDPNIVNVAKSGRSTGLTCSTLSSINTTVNLTYTQNCGAGPSFQATFNDLVVIAGGNFATEGDSGALIVSQNTAAPVALLIAASDTDALGNPVTDVLPALADPNSGETPVFVGTAAAHTVAACSLPGPSTAAALRSALARVAPATEKLQRAGTTASAHALALLQNSQILAIGPGASLDEPGEPAILLFVPSGTARDALPRQLDGVRTRIVEEPGSFTMRGSLSAAETLALDQSSVPARSTSILSAAEVLRAQAVQGKHANQLLHLEGVQGVGITSSADSPGEAALMIFVVRGTAHGALPPIIDGLRTRIRESSAFRAGAGSRLEPQTCTTATDGASHSQ